MQKLGWLFLFCSMSLQAQDVINNPPISLDPVDGKELVQEVGPVALPVDGQLKLGEQPSLTAPEINEVKIEVKPEVKAEVETAPVLPIEEVKFVEATRYYPPQKYLQFSFGYLNSKWSKADASLEDGSTLTDFRAVSDMNEHNQIGFAIGLIQDLSGEASPENIRSLEYKIFIDYHRTIFSDKLDWLAGVALSLGDYSIRKLRINSAGEVVYTKLKTGTVYGLIPSMGVRFYFSGRNSLDITAEYHQYLSNPQSYIGGFAFVPRFSFTF